MLTMKKLNLTPEERKIYELNRNNESRKKKMANWAPEQLLAYKQKNREGWERWKLTQPKEHLKEIHETAKSNRKKVYASWPLERKEKERQRKLIAYKNQTEEQKKRQRQNGIKRMFELKMKVLNHYSNGNVHCTNPDCEVPGGAKDVRALQIDHIHGGGNKHRIKLRAQGLLFYKWLIDQGYPPGYQVYCACCNTIKRSKNNENRKYKDEVSS